MWRVNDVVEYDKKRYRILFVASTKVVWLCIDENKGIPTSEDIDSLEDLVAAGELAHVEDPYGGLQGMSPEEGSADFVFREKAYKTIESVIADDRMYFKKERAPLLKKAAQDAGVSTPTMYKYLRRYWQRGQIRNALLPDYKNSGAAGSPRNFKDRAPGQRRIYTPGQTVPLNDDIRQQFRRTIENFLGATETAKSSLVVESAANSSFNEPPKTASEEVSTDEPTEGGVLPAADFAGPDDQTDLTRMYESRFEAFNHMLELLQEKGVILLSKTITPLPQSGRGKKHLLITGEPRVICCAEVSFQGRLSYILEVDTSDGQSKLSSKVFGNTFGEWPEIWGGLLEGLTANQLGWPTKYMAAKALQSQVHSIRHPPNKGPGSGNVPMDSYLAWASCFLSAL